LVHNIPGRIRLKADNVRGETTRFAEAVRAIEALPGVTGVVANPLTGSVLIQHGRDAASLLEDIARADVIVPASNPTFSGRAAYDAQAALDRLRGATTGIGPQFKILLVLGLVALAVRQAAEGHVLAPAVTLLWYAYSVLGAQPSAAPAASITVH
jgi:hypothetical protein